MTFDAYPFVSRRFQYVSSDSDPDAQQIRYEEHAF